MTSTDLRYEIETELLEQTVHELLELYKDTENKNPTVREKTAASAFLAQFYGGVENILKRISRHFVYDRVVLLVCGVENILKRISRHRGIPLPMGDSWHIDIFNRFCKPSYQDLPVLFDESLALSMSAYRKFRHVVHHGYGFQIEWDRLKEGILQIENVFDAFRAGLFRYLHSIEFSPGKD